MYGLTKTNMNGKLEINYFANILRRNIVNTYILSEKLLDSWLGITATVSNDRLVEGLTFNEAFVCNIISKTINGENIIASKLCEKTGIQKSQMNKILNSLEKKKLIVKERSSIDKRNINIKLNLENISIYDKAHKKSISVVKGIIDEIGVNKTLDLINLINEVNYCFKKRESSKNI